MSGLCWCSPTSAQCRKRCAREGPLISLVLAGGLQAALAMASTTSRFDLSQIGCHSFLLSVMGSYLRSAIVRAGPSSARTPCVFLDRELADVDATARNPAAAMTDLEVMVATAEGGPFLRKAARMCVRLRSDGHASCAALPLPPSLLRQASPAGAKRPRTPYSPLYSPAVAPCYVFQSFPALFSSLPRGHNHIVPNAVIAVRTRMPNSTQSKICTAPKPMCQPTGGCAASFGGLAFSRFLQRTRHLIAPRPRPCSCLRVTDFNRYERLRLRRETEAPQFELAGASPDGPCVRHSKQSTPPSDCRLTGRETNSQRRHAIGALRARIEEPIGGQTERGEATHREGMTQH